MMSYVKHKLTSCNIYLIKKRPQLNVSFQIPCQIYKQPIEHCMYQSEVYIGITLATKENYISNYTGFIIVVFFILGNNIQNN